LSQDHEEQRQKRLQNIQESERLKKHEILAYLRNKKVDLADRRALDVKEFQEIAEQYEREAKERSEKRSKTLKEEEEKRKNDFIQGKRTTYPIVSSRCR
jgi:hypothetical protein